MTAFFFLSFLKIVIPFIYFYFITLFAKNLINSPTQSLVEKLRKIKLLPKNEFYDRFSFLNRLR